MMTKRRLWRGEGAGTESLTRAMHAAIARLGLRHCPLFESREPTPPMSLSGNCSSLGVAEIRWGRRDGYALPSGRTP